MNVIMGMSELMPTENLSEIQLNYFNDIKHMSESLLGIINDILDFSKIEAGKLDIVPVHFNLYALFNNISSIFQFISSGKGLEWSASIKSAPEFFYGDAGRIRQIFINIINNAIKYTAQGQVRFTLSQGMKNGTEYLVGVVEDSGSGIRSEDIPKLFESFRQLNGQPKQSRDVMGSGLGLAISKELLDLMDGFIEVESEYGAGSRFAVFIPLAAGDPTQIADNNQALPLVRAPDNTAVLVVDDMPVNLTVAKGFLAFHNITPDTALSGAEALRKVQQKAHEGRGYDLIFMDHMMPEMDGIEATRRIREMDAGRNIPIVAFTANVITGVKQQFLDAGMNDFIAKPIEAAELNAVLRRWLPGAG
jgi:CheY-like chemotaxis protein